jgi:hypothetical protein
MHTPTRYRNRDRAEERFGSLARDYSDALSVGDELGDAALMALDALGEDGRPLLERALAGDVGAVARAPAELRALFADLTSPQFEIDLARIDRGARALGRCGFAYGLATKQALYWGYCSGAAVKPLAWTGELRQQQAALRRLTETAAWTFTVLRPGQLARHAPGWSATVRVRLVHARVRRALRSSGRWDQEAWGAPINLADQAMTLLEFSHLPLRTLGVLGIRFGDEELEGIYALWRYVGHLIGIPMSINPDGGNASARLQELMELTRDPPDEDSIELVAATLRSTRVGAMSRVDRVSAAMLESLERELAWRCLPEDQLQRLRFPPSRSSDALAVLNGVIHIGETLHRTLPATAVGLEMVNRQLNDHLIAELRQRAERTSGGARRESPVGQPSTTQMVSAGERTGFLGSPVRARMRRRG